MIETLKNVSLTPSGAVKNAVELSNINRETYLMLTPVFKALIISTNSAGKYGLLKRDEAMGFYFYYSELNLSIKVPLTALFNVNDKTKGILGIKWASARHCPSRARGLCQLDNANNCYAITGEKQGSKKSYNYLLGMGSYYNSLICIDYWAQFYQDDSIKATFLKYCAYYGVDTLRFNLSGDFKNLNDIKNLDTLAGAGLKLTGYTARDDLRGSLMNVINKHDNIILNGSNMMYNNRFEATDSIKEYFNAQHSCKGGCLVNGCLNCYKLKGVVITVLIHGAGVGVDLNTPDNRAFITSLLNAVNIDITAQQLKRFKDLYRAVNTLFKRGDYFKLVPKQFLGVNRSGETVFNGHNGFILYLKSLYNAQGGL